MSATVELFKRHSRAQGIALVHTAPSGLPTNHELGTILLALSKEGARRQSRVLNVRQTPSWIPSEQGPNISPKARAPKSSSQRAQQQTTPPAQTETAAVPRSNWVDCIKLGTLVQGGQELSICRSRDSQRLFMLKDVGREARDCAGEIGTLQHRHIASASFQIETESTCYLAFPYGRYTLEELLHTHVTIEESHIRAIALPIFQAIKYLHEKALFYGRISAQLIRICGRTGTIVLGDCDGSKKVAKPTSIDLEGLSITLLNCIEGRLTDLTVARVRECRASNKVFGLSDPERWSEHKQLVDFVDDIFSAQRKHAIKFTKPHEYVAHRSWDPEALVPLAELASLECFALWHAAL